ncbi:MAG: hypothetical protein ABH881_04320 [bacterium]
MKDQLEKAISLAQKTGDRLLVYNCQKADSAYVVMSIEEYEKLTVGQEKARNLTEDELLDRINRDIATWKNEQENVESVAVDDEGDNEILLSDDDSEEEEAEDDEKNEDEKQKSWTIPSDRKNAADEVIDEDRQYLEEISF